MGLNFGKVCQAKKKKVCVERMKVTFHRRNLLQRRLLTEEQRQKAKIISFADFLRDNFGKHFRAFKHIHSLNFQFCDDRPRTFWPRCRRTSSPSRASTSRSRTSATTSPTPGRTSSGCPLVSRV